MCPVKDPAPASAVELLLLFARAGHDAGYPTADLEDRLLALAEALQLGPAQVSDTPTVLEIALGSLADQHTYTLRVRPAAADLGAIAVLDDIAGGVLDGSCDVAAALDRVRELAARPPRLPWPLVLAAYSLAGASLTPVLGGGPREALAGAAVGAVTGAIALPATRDSRTEPMLAPVAGAAASFAALGLARLGAEISSDVVTLAALVTFLPGMRLTIGMRELTTEHLQSGVANTASALVQLLGLVFGVGVGRSVADNWFGVERSLAPSIGGFSTLQLLAAVGAGLAFTVTLRARPRDALVMCAATVLALSANRVGSTVFGADAGVFVAALVVGAVGGLVGVYLRRSPLVFIVPGVLMLVPGSAGFTSALQLMSNQTVSGITAAFDTFVTAMSIAYGLLVSSLLLPRRMTRLAAPEHPADGGAR